MTEIIAKFGGTSMAQPELVADIINQQDSHLIVVSAPGKTDFHETKITDLLIRYAEVRSTNPPLAQSYGDEIIDRFDDTYQMLSNSQRSALKDSASKMIGVGEMTPSYYISLGERLSAEYFAHLIGGVAVTPAIRFAANELDRQRTFKLIQTQHDVMFEGESRPVVVPGFYGMDEVGNYQLLGRGGSDRTGALYAAALELDYENWTDVDGIYNADPRKVKGASPLSIVTRSEVREGAHGGSGVLQGDTMVDLNGSNITVHVKNTNNSSSPGTQVVSARELDPNRPIIATSSRALDELQICDLGMAQTSGYLARVLKEVEALGMSVEHMPAAQDAVTLTFSASYDSDNRLEELRNIVSSQTLSPHANVAIKEKGVVYVVGEGLRNPNVATNTLGQIACNLYNQGLGFEASVSHPSSPSLALLVAREDIDNIQQAIFDGFVKS